MPTPAGGIVSDDFFIDIIHQQDTMRIYPPNIQIQDIELDSIPFKKGIYKIPQTVYDFKEFAKKKMDIMRKFKYRIYMAIGICSQRKHINAI